MNPRRVAALLREGAALALALAAELEGDAPAAPAPAPAPSAPKKRPRRAPLVLVSSEVLDAPVSPFAKKRAEALARRHGIPLGEKGKAS